MSSFLRNQTWLLQAPFQLPDLSRFRLPDIPQFQLDIAGFLAILGEGSVLANYQVASLSPVVFLPRLLPAPQALMMPSRPSKLEPAVGYTTGVDSGNHRDYINYVGHVLVDAESLPDYSIRCVEIRRKRNDEVKAKAFGPLWTLAMLGFLESVFLFTLSVWHRDDAALVATVSLSALSSLIGVGNKWTLNLPKRNKAGPPAPPGNVAIRYTNGNFLLVQCSEEVARELYFAPENMRYLITHAWEHRVISLAGTVLLMVGIVALGNASRPLQLGFAAAYVVLNAAYWVVAALPSEMHWDTSCFEVREQCLEAAGASGPAKGEEKPGPGGVARRARAGDLAERSATFTQALWKAIVVTKKIHWIERSHAAPETPVWAAWLREARQRARTAGFRDESVDGRTVRVWEVPEWDAQAALGEMIMIHKRAHVDGSDSE